MAAFEAIAKHATNDSDRKEAEYIWNEFHGNLLVPSSRAVELFNRIFQLTPLALAMALLDSTSGLISSDNKFIADIGISVGNATPTITILIRKAAAKSNKQ